MDNIIKCVTHGKAQPPQPIRMTGAKWGGSPEKMEDGSEPQPWHCLPFVEGSTYGLEVIYPYERACRVVAAGGSIRFDWDFAGEPGVQLTGAEFGACGGAGAAYYAFDTGLE